MTTQEFQESITRVCARDTSADPEHWSDTNVLWGHCAVVSLLAQEQFGGTLLRQSLAGVVGLEHVRSHYFNRFPDGSVVDFTIGQFQGRLLPGLPTEERSKESVLSYPNTWKRYELLKSRFESYSSG